MMPFDRARERYMHDPQFRALVDSLQASALRLELTPSEIREAATFACILIEEWTARPIRYSDEQRRAFREDFERVQEELNK
jgi:hypothetical protein